MFWWCMKSKGEKRVCFLMNASRWDQMSLRLWGFDSPTHTHTSASPCVGTKKGLFDSRGSIEVKRDPKGFLGNQKVILQMMMLFVAHVARWCKKKIYISESTSKEGFRSNKTRVVQLKEGSISANCDSRNRLAENSIRNNVEGSIKLNIRVESRKMNRIVESK